MLDGGAGIRSREVSPMSNNAAGSAEQIFGSIIAAPNPTGELHLGHVLNLVIEDALCRWNALKGARICWEAVLDHGATATEYVVARMHRDKGVDTSLWTREARKGAISAWVEEIIPRIYDQMDKLDLVADRSEMRWMGDAKRERQFQEIIAELIGRGIVYRARAVVPWCTRLSTSVDKADIIGEEAVIDEYRIRYTCDDPRIEAIDLWLEYPETLPADAALVVSSGHAAAALPHSFVSTPIGLNVPIVVDDIFFADASPQIARLVPGHCAKSFRWARKHGQAVRRAYDERGIMELGEHRGQRRDEAAAALLQAIADQGRLVDKRQRRVQRRVFRVSGGPVEEFLTEQCFIETTALAERALSFLRDRKVRVYPRHYHAGLEAYLDGIISAKRNGTNSEFYDDWCISHQTAWGTALDAAAIPFRAGADGAGDKGGPYVASMRLSCALFSFAANRDDATSRAELDLLSAGSVLVTGVDLLLFWVLPTIMLAAGLKAGPPMRDTIVHPLVCDSKGLKMTKSLGNVIAPDAILEAYGSDALRFSLLSDLDLKKEKMFFDEARVRTARLMLDDVAAAASAMRDRLAASGIVAAEDCSYARQIFEHIEAALAEYDFVGAMATVKSTLQTISDAARSTDLSEIRRLLSVLPLLAPFMPKFAAAASLEPVARWRSA
jgi:valyl-tRNA synthetase